MVWTVCYPESQPMSRSTSFTNVRERSYASPPISIRDGYRVNAILQKSLPYVTLAISCPQERHKQLLIEHQSLLGSFGIHDTVFHLRSLFPVRPP
jgi:hypothetical protein